MRRGGWSPEELRGEELTMDTDTKAPLDSYSVARTLAQSTRAYAYGPCGTISPLILMEKGCASEG